MRTKIGIILMSVFILGACQSIDEKSISKIQLNGNGYYVLFFSNEKNIELEENYYDALLVLKEQYKKELANVYLIQSSNKSDKIKKFNVDVYPTLIVIKDGKTIVRLEGKQSKKDILQEITKAIN